MAKKKPAKKSVQKKVEALFDKDKLDEMNAQGLGEHRLVPIKELGRMEKEGLASETRQFEKAPVLGSGPRFSPLESMRTQTMPLSMIGNEAENPLVKIADFLAKDVEVFTSTQVTEDEIKNIAVLMADEKAKRKKERCDLFVDSVDNFLRLRISLDRQSRKEHKDLGMAYGMGQTAARNGGFFEDIKAQFEKMAGRNR